MLHFSFQFAKMATWRSPLSQNGDFFIIGGNCKAMDNPDTCVDGVDGLEGWHLILDGLEQHGEMLERLDGTCSCRG